MVRELNSSERPFAFEQLARQQSEWRQSLNEMMERLSSLPDGDAKGIVFSLFLKKNAETEDLLEDLVGTSERRPFVSGTADTPDASGNTHWRADVRVERAGSEQQHYRLALSRIVIGKDLQEWEMLEIGEEVARDSIPDDGMLPDAPYFVVSRVDDDGLVHLTRLRSAVATDEQFRAGLKVWTEKGGRIDMGEMLVVWDVVVEPYSRTIVEKFVDGEDNDL